MLAFVGANMPFIFFIWANDLEQRRCVASDAVSVHCLDPLPPALQAQAALGASPTVLHIDRYMHEC